MSAEARRRLVAAGYTLVPLCSLEKPHNHDGKPCKTPGKVPPPGWQKAQAGAYDEQKLAGRNYGVVLRADDLVVDIDPRNFDPRIGDSLDRLRKAVGSFPETLSVKTGGGGFHHYFKLPAGARVVETLPEFPGIEFKSLGRQVVGPGCGHVSGRTYELLGDYQVADVPAALLALISRKDDPRPLTQGAGDYQDDDATRQRFTAYLKEAAAPSIQGQGGDRNAFQIACRGRDLGLSPAATLELLLKDWNPRCAPPWGDDELRAKVAHAYRYGRNAVGAAHPAADFGPVPAQGRDGASNPGAGGIDDKSIPWVLTPNGAYVRCFKNLLNFFSFSKAGLRGVVGQNEFTGRVEFLAPAPWKPSHRTVNDTDLKLAKAHLAVQHGFEMPVTAMEEAVSVIAYGHRFHPVRDYLRGLQWDGVARLDSWLVDLLGVEDSAYARAAGRKVLCAAVKRIFAPGCKFDHVLVLEGPQDLGKSAVCKILGGSWATDSPLDPHNKDSIALMQGKWIIELAELEVTRRADMQALKAFITRTKDEARLAYGRMVAEFPRQSIFIGSINPNADHTYLADDENRRWWPVVCHGKTETGQFDFAALEAARDQLWAEAVVRYDAEPLSMHTKELKDAAREVVALRHAEHAWTERVAAWLQENDRKAETRRDFLTARDVYVEAMGGVDKQLDRRSCLAIAQCLRVCGWQPAVKWIAGRAIRGYVRVAPAVPWAPSSEEAAALGDLL